MTNDEKQAPIPENTFVSPQYNCCIDGIRVDKPDSGFAIRFLRMGGDLARVRFAGSVQSRLGTY